MAVWHAVLKMLSASYNLNGGATAWAGLRLASTRVKRFGGKLNNGTLVCQTPERKERSESPPTKNSDRHCAAAARSRNETLKKDGYSQNIEYNMVHLIEESYPSNHEYYIRTTPRYLLSRHPEVPKCGPRLHL